jgi:hypothetical protein
VTAEALRALRDLVAEREETLTFADLSSPLLEDLALGWTAGRPFAEHAAEFLERVDGIPAATRAPELAGRALLTLMARRRTGPEPETPADGVRLLGDAATDRGDAEGLRAYERREREIASLSERSPEYTANQFAADAAGAFQAVRTRADEGRALPADEIAAEHPLALVGMSLPPGLRAWFHERHDAARADLVAWKFVLVSRALARHHAAMSATGVLEGQGTAVPKKLLEALLATDLGDPARPAAIEP